MKPKFRRFLPAASIHLVLAVSALPAMAIAYDWDNDSTDDLWDTPTNWNPDGLPTTGDNVFVTVDSATTKTISLPATPANATILEVGLARTGNGTATINHSGGELTVTSWFNLGQGFGTAPADGTGIWNMSGSAKVNATHASGLTTIGAGFTATGYNTGILSITDDAWFNQTANPIHLGGEGAGSRAKGVINLSGNGQLTNTSSLLVGVAGNGSTGVANVSGNSTLTVNQILMGTNTGATGAIHQSGGTVSTALSGPNALSLGYVTNGFGSYRISGGSLTSNEIAVGAELFFAPSTMLGGSGILDISGGNVNNTGWLVMNRMAGDLSLSQSAVLNVSGGSLTYNGGGLVSNWGNNAAEEQFSAINVSGTGSISTGNNSPVRLGWGNSPNNFSLLNLNGGTVTPSRVFGLQSYVNFNGGTLRANSTQGDFLAVTNAQVRSGGAVIDTNNFDITIWQPLLSPVDQGVTAIAVNDGGAGYISAPILRISGGTGSGATAIANMVDDGSGNGTFRIGSITVTGAGNYTVAPDTITQIGGAPATSATLGTITIGANTSGGLTKHGAGTLTLNSTATNYTGPTQITAGRLTLNGNLASAVAVAAAADLGGAGQSSGSLTFAAGSHNFFFNPAAATPLRANGITATGATITVMPEGVLGSIGGKPILQSTSGPITGSIANFVSGHPRLVLELDESGTQLLATITPIYWMGASANPTFWDNGVTANWETPDPGVFLPGDAVIFDDAAVPASPVSIAVQAAVQPGAVTFQNFDKDYVISGEAITGTTGITLNGGGNVTMSNSNTYSGTTLVTDGTLELSGTNTGLGALAINGSSAKVKITGGSSTFSSIWGETYVASGTLEVDGGALILQNGATGTWVTMTGTTTLQSGSLTTTNYWGFTTGGGLGVININGGTFIANGVANNGIILGEFGGGDGTLNLNGGVLITDQIRGGAGVGTVNFDGGKLQATGDLTDVFANNANLTTTIQSGGLKVGGTPNFTISEPLAGNGGLTKEDANTVTLTGLNTYTGNTVVSAGVLAISQPYLADASAVTIATDAKIALNFTGDDTVASVTLGGTTYTTPGSYNATTFPDFFTGDGSLVIGGAINDYDTWKSANGVTGGKTDDDDNDGLSNFDEYAFGLNPVSGGSVNPIVSQLNKASGQFSYNRRLQSKTGLTYTVRSSTTLATGGWTNLVKNTGYTESVSAPSGDNETVTITLTPAPTAAKLFIQVKAD
jgi:autotransporter-associated beta strand protein